MEFGSEFVLDELICFLGHPLFQMPTMTFIESRCVCFDKFQEDCPEFRQMHAEYCGLLDMLLEGFREDSQLTQQQIIKAVNNLNMRPDLRTVFKSSFDPILAWVDYKFFVHMMIDKNLEIQQQALLLILKRTGKVPESLVTKDVTKCKQEVAVMEAVTEASNKEEERRSTSEPSMMDEMKKKEDVTLAHAAMIERERTSLGQEKLTQAISSMKIEEHSVPAIGQSSLSGAPVLKKAPAKSATAAPASLQPVRSIPPPSTVPKSEPAPKHDIPRPKVVKKPVSNADAAAEWLTQAKQESTSKDSPLYDYAATLSKMDDSELQKRQEFLKEQRDKLIQMKKVEREKQLKDAEQSAQTQRPKSSRAARSTMQRSQKEAPAVSSEDEKKIAMRRAIAARLRQEVVGKK